jgi:hypothetical protein
MGNGLQVQVIVAPESGQFYAERLALVSPGVTLSGVIASRSGTVPQLTLVVSGRTVLVSALTDVARRGNSQKANAIATGQTANSLGLSRITGTEGGVVRFRAPEEGAYDLRARSMIAADGFRQLPADQPRSAQDVLADLATGEDALKLWLNAADTAGGKYRAAFVRAKRTGENLVLAGGGGLLIWQTKPYRSGSVMAARIDSTGTVTWSVDTGIGDLRQVLPDPATPAFIGERPKIPDKLSEPILVIVDAATGRVTTHSLWLK